MSNWSSINSAELSEFEKKVYLSLAQVPRGKVITYKALANLAGFPGAARAVGNAMNKNPFAPKVPCHRVVKSTGELGGFAHGQKQKKELLRGEGVLVENERVVNFQQHKF